MNVRIWKWTGLVVLVVSMVCVISYADKGEGKSVTLPDAVKNAVLAALPQGVIEKTKMEEQEFKIYAVILKQNGQESELKITPDSTVLAVETKVGKETIPDAVAKALSKSAEGAEIKGVEQKVTYAVVKPVKLDVPETTYEADITKDGNNCEVKLAANGTVLEKSAWQKPGGKDECKGGDNEKKDEQKVSIDQVPPAVKATILSQAGNGTIRQIEQETRDGKIIYGAETSIDGKKVEIKISSDGKLLDKQVEDKCTDDNDDNDGEDNDD
jgi:uncharacterized membrane protein YkoI